MSQQPCLVGLLGPAPCYSTKGARDGGSTKRGFFGFLVHSIKGEETVPINNDVTVAILSGAGARKGYTEKALSSYMPPSFNIFSIHVHTNVYIHSPVLQYIGTTMIHTRWIDT